MLCSNSWRGELSPLEMVSHISTPSRSVSLLVSPPAKPYKVGTQSDTCIRSRLTRPLDFNKGLWTKAAPRTPPVNKIYSQNHSSKSKLNRDCLTWKIKKNKCQPPHFFQAEEVTVLILTFSESTSWIYIFFKLSPSVVSSFNRISNFEIKIISKLTQDLHHLENIHIIFTRSCWIDFTDSCLLFCSGCVGVYQYLSRSSREEVVDRFTVTVVLLQSRLETNQFNL